jgi:hypothetical protein
VTDPEVAKSLAELRTERDRLDAVIAAAEMADRNNWNAGLGDCLTALHES